jgi:ribosomal protein L16/L10AE
MHFLPTQPKQTRYSSPSFQRSRLQPKSRLKQKQKSANSGNWRYWVIVKETCRINHTTLSGLRLSLKHEMHKLTDFHFYASFCVPITGKPGLRMGTGKGKIKEWLAEFKRGQLLLSFESCGGKLITQRVIRLLRHKLPIKIKIISR